MTITEEIAKLSYALARETNPAKCDKMEKRLQELDRLRGEAAPVVILRGRGT